MPSARTNQPSTRVALRPSFELFQQPIARCIRKYLPNQLPSLRESPDHWQVPRFVLLQSTSATSKEKRQRERRRERAKSLKESQKVEMGGSRANLASLLDLIGD